MIQFVSVTERVLLIWLCYGEEGKTSIEGKRIDAGEVVEIHTLEPHSIQFYVTSTTFILVAVLACMEVLCIRLRQ